MTVLHSCAAALLVLLGCAPHSPMGQPSLDAVCPLDRHPPAAVSDSSAGEGLVTGRLVTASRGEPLTRRLLRADLVDSVGGWRHADFDTAFVFTAVRPGRYQLRVRALGYSARIDTVDVRPGRGLALTLPLTEGPLDGCGSLGFRPARPWWRVW